MNLARYLEESIQEDLQEKMVFLAGPRQVGKTTLAQNMINQNGPGAYYLWDNRHDRQALLKSQWPPEARMIVLDELHKYSKWKQWIKGEYDIHKNRLKFMVTGSARLDVYRRGGDSLQGRYHHYRLHPFSQNEINHMINPLSPFDPLSFLSKNHNNLETLLNYSGFPEPLLAQNAKKHRRWQKEHIERFFREDLRDLENIRDLSSIQLLSDLLPHRVGSPLSLNSLREDLEVSHKALTHWMTIFEKLYYVFRLNPYSGNMVRALKKEPKIYLWDWTLIEDVGYRYENMMASHLLKFCHYLEDTEGYKIELWYLRDLDKREVDFLVTVNNKPWFAVEAKLSGHDLSPSLKYFGSRLKIPFLFQVVLKTEREFVKDAIHLIPANKFLTAFV